MGGVGLGGQAFPRAGAPGRKKKAGGRVQRAARHSAPYTEAKYVSRGSHARPRSARDASTRRTTAVTGVKGKYAYMQPDTLRARRVRRVCARFTDSSACQGPRLKGRRLANKAFLRGIVPAENAVHRTRTRPTASTL